RLLPIVEREEDQSYFLGICYIMQGAEQCENKDYESAFRCLEKARYLEPGLEGTEEELTHYRFFLHNGLGLCYWMFDKNNLAIEAYEIAIASGEKRAIKDFAYFQCHALAGIIQFGDNNLEKAEQYLEVCMQEDSFWWDQNHSLEKLVKYAWAMLMSLKDNNSEAEFYFDQYLDELPAELEEARGLLLSRQAMVYSDSGRYERAIEMQLAAIAYFEEHQPEAVEFRLVALRDLTTSYAFTRQKKEAILSNKKAIHLARATYGESDLRVLDLEVNLVGIYNIFFDHYGGIRIIEKGMKFFDQNPEHKKSHVYVLLVGAAVSTYSSLGDEENTQKYSQLFSQAREKNPYIDDIIQSEGLVDMSLKHISKDKKGAIETMNTSMGSILSELEANFGYLTEAEKVIFLQKYRLKLYLFFVYLAEAMGKGETKDASHALILWLRLKGLVLYSHSNLMRQVYEQANEQSAPTLDQWKSLRARKIALFESEESFDAQQSEDISQKISQLEKALNFRQKDREDIPEVDLKALRDHLHPNEAALEFVSLSPPMGLGEEIPFQIYVVFILLPDQENILLHMIEKGNEIEEIIGKLGRTHTQEAHQALAEELWTYLWQPIASILEPYSTIYLCVDGMLSLCNFNLFRNPDSKALLMDEKELIYLTSIRSLESVKAPRPAFPGMNLILGAPDYGPPGWANWSPLPGAKEETQQIAFLLDDHQISLQIFQGQEAKKEKLWEHTSPGILHLATHAYFSPPEFQAYPEPDFEEYVEFNQFRGMGVPPPSNLGEHEEAMFHAGIVLAGANASNKGILTAFEVSQLDLSETQLVVLSGCETGLGKVTEGEGVFGLQRAFFAAGAKAIIMSLWSVPDEPTQHLFQLFYEYWLQDQDKQLAFRKAQQAVRGRFPNPRDWGGFILLEN
ncbi:MAG: CHAT domain-containing protein, partial [Bacteroidota bacterium]